MLNQTTSTNIDALYCPNIRNIEHLHDRDTYLYILRSINRIIKFSFTYHENKSVLENRLKKLDDDCDLNGLLANIPLDSLIEQLDDEELIYCI